MPFVIANGISLHYHIFGEGEPVLWIQGLGADHSAWAAQMNTFQHKYRCVAFDNRDVGQSEQVTRPYRLADMAADAAALLGVLGIEEGHVVGLSMGGAIAQELALRYPRRVRSLVLVSTAARQDARGHALIGSWPDIYRKAGLLDFYRQAVAWMFSYRFFERPRAVPAMLRYVQNHTQSPDAFARQVAAGLDVDTVSRLSQIHVPTLVIAGEEDILVPLRLSRALAAGIPNARCVVIPEAAHSVNVEQVARFNTVVDEFLR